MVKVKSNTILLYIIALFTVISSRSTYLYITNSSAIYSIMAYGVIPLMWIDILTCSSNKVLIDRKRFITAVSILLLLGIYCIFSQTDVEYSILLISTVITIYIYCSVKEQLNYAILLETVCNIIFFLAVVSIVMWLLGSILHLLPYKYITANWGTSGYNKTGNLLKSYLMIQFENDQTYLFGKLFTCNKSIFIERGFAAYNFNIALYYEMLINKNKGKAKKIILIIAVITTFSTAGFVTLSIFLTGYYLINGNNNILLKIFRVFSAPLVLALSYIFINYVMETKMGYMHSYSSRMQDFINGFEIWKQSPIFGYGYANSRIINEFHTGYSNSVSAVLTQGGLVLFIPYFSSFIGGTIRSLRQHNLNKALFIIMLLINVVFANVPFLNITIYLLVYVGAYEISPLQVNELEDNHK